MKDMLQNNIIEMDSEVLDKLHKVELEIMDEIHRICMKHNIVYYLAGGSVLGAIRHGGFIPWDDDIDICMPRKEYNRFFDVCKKELDKRFFLQSECTDCYYGKIISKIRKEGTIFLEKQVENSYAHQGIFVDIFILDDIRKTKYLQKILYKIIWFCTRILNVKCGWEPSKKVTKFFYGLIPSVLIRKIRYILMTIYNKKKEKYYINYGSQYGMKKQTFEKGIYGVPKLVQFEDRYYYVPEKTDEFLTQIYGKDYMKLPPIDRRVCHSPILIDFGME